MARLSRLQTTGNKKPYTNFSRQVPARRDWFAGLGAGYWVPPGDEKRDGSLLEGETGSLAGSIGSLRSHVLDVMVGVAMGYF